MLRALFLFVAALTFASSANAQTRVHADPWALDPPIVRMPPSSGYYDGPVGSAAPRYPSRLRDYANPRAEYGFTGSLKARRR
jgi:hypothetical protein